MSGKRKAEDSIYGIPTKNARQQKFKTEYSLQYPCIKKSKESEYKAFCTLCRSHISVSHSGIRDCRTHVETAGHKKKAEEAKRQPDIAASFGISKSSDNDQKHKIMVAELKLTDFIVEHNVNIML